jgi:hypothetical protein
VVGEVEEHATPNRRVRAVIPAAAGRNMLTMKKRLLKD